MPGFQIIGSTAILKLGLSRKEALLQAQKILKSLPRIKSVYIYSGPVSGELRKPQLSFVAGERNSITTHRENGCLYKLDITKAMFSKGNVSERGRLPKLVKPGEIIIDMFAGIGYFSLPLGKSSPGRRIYSIELNPDSFRFLQENIKLNRLEGKVIPIKGDCRKVKLPEKADRVIMGYFPGTEKFLPATFRLLKPKGIIHYHTLSSKDGIPKAEKKLKERAQESGFSLIKILNRKIVKQYSPGIYHIVIDTELRRTSPPG